MTERKQKAIEIIARELHKANRLLLHSLCTPEFHKTCYACTNQAKALYDRIATLREFPEEAVEEFAEFPEKEIGLIFSEYGHKVADDPSSQYLQLPRSDEFIIKIKCLLHGQKAKTGDANFWMFEERLKPEHSLGDTMKDRRQLGDRRNKIMERRCSPEGRHYANRDNDRRK